MSVTITRTNLVSTFIDNWTDTPVVTQNVRHPPDNTPYALIQLAQSVSEQPCLGRAAGQTWERDIGDCIIGIHVPVNYEGDGLEMAEKAKRVLSQQRFNETITDVGYVVAAGVAPNDERYFVYQVRIPYRTDNLREA